MGLLLLYLFLALSVSFFCSTLEATLLSITPSYIHTQEKEGKPYARSLQKLKQQIDKPLSAILSFNTIAHTVGAAGVGAQAVKIFGNQYFGLISAALTIAILVLSEIIPKSLGANYWRQLAPYISGPLNAMMFVLYPFVKISEFITKAFKSSGESSVSREEVAALTNIATKEGIFEEGESKIINNLIRFKSILVEFVMTPRTVARVLEESLTLEEFFADKESHRFSRIPVYKDSIDNITGYILKYDVLEKLAEDHFNLSLRDLRRDICVVYENDSIPQVLEMMMGKREHIALVVDKYGGTAGIVTLEDILETLLGLEIQDEMDSEADMQQLARNQWQERAKKMGIIIPGTEDI